MLKDEVIRLRTFHKNNKAKSLRVICDNLQLLIDGSEYVIWDDANETLYGIRVNHDHYTQVEAPIEVITTTYEMIQFIEGIYSKEGTTSVISNLSSNGLITQKQKEILDIFVKNINNMDAVPKYDKYPASTN